MNYTDSQLVTTPDIHQLAVENLVRLIRKLDAGENPSDDFLEVGQLLESLPMASGEFGLAKNRLKNARRYMQSRERGGARWELAALLDSLRREGNAAPAEPRRRRMRNGKLNGNIELQDHGEAPPAVVGSFILFLFIGVYVGRSFGFDVIR